jgi:hypothetical protein
MMGVEREFAMLRKKVAILAVCAFAFGIGLATSAVAACNNTCRMGCESTHDTCSGAECELAYIQCYRRCGCVLP